MAEEETIHFLVFQGEKTAATEMSHLFNDVQRLFWHEKCINLPQCVAVAQTLLEIIQFDLDIIKNQSRRNPGRVTADQRCIHKTKSDSFLFKRKVNLAFHRA